MSLVVVTVIVVVAVTTANTRCSGAPSPTTVLGQVVSWGCMVFHCDPEKQGNVLGCSTGFPVRGVGCRMRVQ